MVVRIENVVVGVSVLMGVVANDEVVEAYLDENSVALVPAAVVAVDAIPSSIFVVDFDAVKLIEIAIVVDEIARPAAGDDPAKIRTDGATPDRGAGLHRDAVRAVIADRTVGDRAPRAGPDADAVGNVSGGGAPDDRAARLHVKATASIATGRAVQNRDEARADEAIAQVLRSDAGSHLRTVRETESDDVAGCNAIPDDGSIAYGQSGRAGVVRQTQPLYQHHGRGAVHAPARPASHAAVVEMEPRLCVRHMDAARAAAADQRESVQVERYVVRSNADAVLAGLSSDVADEVVRAGRRDDEAIGRVAGGVGPVDDDPRFYLVERLQQCVA